MVKKDVDPLLEPILDKIESFDPERADRLRENNATRKVLEVTAEGPKVTTLEAMPEPDVTVTKPVPVKPKPRQNGRHDYRFCNHCGKKGAYTFKSAFETLEFCKYCRPRKKWKNIPAGLLKPAAEPKKKSWLARLFRL